MRHETSFTGTPADEVAPSFARHQTFHPRYGWLKKGFYAAVRDPEVFLAKDATTSLGVGKNMVRAIRYWCQAYKVLEEVPNPANSRLKVSRPTDFGEKVLGEMGWDPYTEDRATLWLLHWELIRPTCSAPSWFALFNSFQASEFTDDTLANQLRLFCDSHPEWGDVATSSLVKDARCLLRMYASVTSGRDLVEDTIDSPFTELDLVRRVQGSKKHYSINRGPKQSLPDEVVAFACLDFASSQDTSNRLMTLSRLTYAPGSPGRAFQLDENLIGESLERFSGENEGISLTQAAGTRQVKVSESLLSEPAQILEKFYDQSLLKAGSLS